jgi:hypothetical protein
MKAVLNAHAAPIYPLPSAPSNATASGGTARGGTASSGSGSAPPPPLAAASGSAAAAAAAAVAGNFLFDLSVDPTESHNLWDSQPGVAAKLAARIAALMAEQDILPACNVPGGSCYAIDPRMGQVAAAEGGRAPWVPPREAGGALTAP